MKFKELCNFLQIRTEQFLTWRKRRSLLKREKQKRKNPIRDWTEVILSAVFIVLLINQLLFQAYQIPTGSMEHTLNIGDRIFVNKLIFGPEIIPGQFKIDGFTKPKRGEIIIFESPKYIPKGPAFEIIYRILYMLTFTLINLDKDDKGNIAVHFLVKRAIGVPGDRIRVRHGDIEIMPAGESKWIGESVMKDRLGISYPVNRFLNTENYKTFNDFAIGTARKNQDIPVMVDNYNQASKAITAINYRDNYFIHKIINRTLFEIYPHNCRIGKEWRKRDIGWYIGDNNIFPMGDNRDNSNDARYFHAVKIEKVLGKASLRFWPFSRFGGIE